MAEIPIICYNCGNTGSVGKVTASLICKTCGPNSDLDVWEPKTAEAHGHGTGWNTRRPDALKDWDEYEGPGPGPNPQAGSHTDGTADAYTGFNWMRGNPNYSPGGGYDKTMWPTGPTTSDPEREENDAHEKTGPPVGGARWQGKASYKVIPAKKSTAINHTIPVKITYADGHTWTSNGATVTSTLLKTSKSEDKLFRMVAAIQEKNSGLTHSEATELAKRALAKFGND